MTEGENKAIEFLKENSLVRLNENNEILAYGNAHKYYIINLIERLQKENEDLTEVNHEQGQCYYQAKVEIENLRNKVEKLQKENEELKNKVIKRDNDIIYLEETAEKEFLTKQEVKENYISKEKVREKIEPKLNKLKEEMNKEFDMYGKSSEYLNLDEQYDFLYEIKELLGGE